LNSKIKSNIFHWFYLFPYCSLLWVSDFQPKSFNLHNTYQKSNRQFYSFTLSSKITDKK